MMWIEVALPGVIGVVVITLGVLISVNAKGLADRIGNKMRAGRQSKTAPSVGPTPNPKVHGVMLIAIGIGFVAVAFSRIGAG